MKIALTGEVAELFIECARQRHEVMRVLDIISARDNEAWAMIKKLYPEKEFTGAAIKCDAEKKTAELTLPFEEYAKGAVIKERVE